MTGGEPFLRKDLFDLFEKHEDMMFQIYTNATLIDKNVAKKHMQLADEFLELSKLAYESNFIIPFIDNLYSAAELFIKATLLIIPDKKLTKKATHKMIQMKYNKFAQLGNVDIEHKDIFNKLAGLRIKARYLKGDINIKDDDAKNFINKIEEIKLTASKLVGV